MGFFISFIFKSLTLVASWLFGMKKYFLYKLPPLSGWSTILFLLIPGAVAESIELEPCVLEIGNLVPGSSQINDKMDTCYIPSLALSIKRTG